MFKLALRNIQSKPFRSIATALAVAVAVAMIFCMLSFKGAVFDYIYSTETAKAGDSDIVISQNSSSDRIFDVLPELLEVEGVERATKSLTLYALINDEYVQLRGFEKNHLQDLQNIDVIEGEIESIDGGRNDFNVVISKNSAEHFGLAVGDRFELAIGRQRAPFFVGAIAEQGGYFLDDAPYQFVGITQGISRLLSSASGGFCNEIYIKTAKNTDVNKVIDSILSIDAYSNLMVKATKDGGYIEEQTDSLTAPVVLAGGAVLALGIAIIVLLFLMSEQEKIALISKLSVVGATRKQLFFIFLIESVLLAGIGIVLGSFLAVGVFVGLLKITLSSNIAFEISALKLFLSALIGFASAIISSILPILRSFKSTIRENQLDIDKKPLFAKILPIALIVLTVISVVVEFCVPKATAVMSIISLALALLTLGVCSAPTLKIFARGCSKSNLPTVKIAGLNVVRQKRFSRSVTMMTVGSTICVMLFMAWSLTTNVFTSYVGDFENMVFISNIQASIDEEQFLEVDGVEHATKMVWKQGDLVVNGKQKTMNLLGSADVIDMVDFEFVTDKSIVYQLISTDKPYIFVDIALQELYDVKVGDTLSFSLDGVSGDVIVGGVLKHELFSGNYIVMSSSVIENLYGIKPDTILLTVDGDMDSAVGELRTKYADRNYYVLKTLDAYKWDMESMTAVFDLIGTLAIVVAIFVFAVSMSATLIGRSGAKKSRCAMLNAGMSKNALLKSELCEHALVAIVSLTLSFAVSVLLIANLIHALRLFGMYFEFMYEAWIVAVVDIVLAIGYIMAPLVFAYKKGYNIKRS